MWVATLNWSFITTLEEPKNPLSVEFNSQKWLLLTKEKKEMAKTTASSYRLTLEYRFSDITYFIINLDRIPWIYGIIVPSMISLVPVTLVYIRLCLQLQCNLIKPILFIFRLMQKISHRRNTNMEMKIFEQLQHRVQLILKNCPGNIIEY